MLVPETIVGKPSGEEHASLTRTAVSGSEARDGGLASKLRKGERGERRN